MQIEPRIEHALVERINGLGILWGNVAVAHMLAYHTGIFAFHQGVIRKLWRERDLVCSMRCLSSILATR